MTPQEVTVWGVHAGKAGDADTLFLTGKTIALGWTKMPDLSSLKADRDDFKKVFARAYPEKKAGAIPTSAGQMFRFVYELREGDVVIYSSKYARQVHIGRVAGPYHHDPQTSAAYPHLRAVNWLASFGRTQFSQGALYELGSAMSFFQIKNYAAEYLAALTGKPPAPRVSEDETVAVVADNLRNQAQDFILKKLAQDLKGHPFSKLVAHLLEILEYRTTVSKPGPDGGVDIVAHRGSLGFEPPLIRVQVKSREGTISESEVSALCGKVAPNEFALFVTLGTFSTPAKNFAKTRGNVRLIDQLAFVELLLEHYEQLDSKYRAILPLQRVYIPVSLEAEEEEEAE